MSTAAEKAGQGIGKRGLAEVAYASEIKDLGWRVEGGDKEWYAIEQEGEKRKIGPAASVGALRTQVGLAVGEPKTVKVGSSTLKGGKYEDKEPVEELVADPSETELETDSKGNRYLPGTAPRVNAQLATAALEHYRVKTARMELTKEEKEKKTKLIDISKLHKELFKKNEETGKLVYMAGDVEVEWIHEEKDDVKTKLIGGDDDE